MFGNRSAWRRLRGRLLGGVAAPALLLVATDLQAGTPSLAPPTLTSVNAPAAPAAPAEVPVLDLAACKALALARQPAIAAAQASYNAALTRQSALYNLG